VDLPLFRPDEEEKVVDFISERLIRNEKEKEIEMIADGKIVTLNPFVRGLLHRLIQAILLSLKGTEGVQEVTLYWRKVKDGKG